MRVGVYHISLMHARAADGLGTHAVRDPEDASCATDTRRGGPGGRVEGRRKGGGNRPLEMKTEGRMLESGRESRQAADGALPGAGGF